MSDTDLIQEPKKKDKKKMIGGLILGAIPLLFIIYLVLGPLLHILSRDLSATEMYVVSEWVNVRAAADVKSLKMGKVDYGTKLLVYEIVDDWAEVLIDGQKGYVSKEFIADPETYYFIEGLFGDKRAVKKVPSTKYRLALMRYLKSKGYTTYIPEDVQLELYGETIDKEVYQIFTEPTGSRFNSTVFADFDGDFRNDAAYILKNQQEDKNILVIISFDKNDPLNISKVIHEQEMEHSWDYIRKAPKGYRYYFKNEDKKTKIPLNGLLIGSNRSRKLNDPVSLLLYNGETFDMFEQPKKK
jgi:hypothetical protein